MASFFLSIGIKEEFLVLEKNPKRLLKGLMFIIFV